MVLVIGYLQSLLMVQTCNQNSLSNKLFSFFLLNYNFCLLVFFLNRFFGGQFTTASDYSSPLNYLASWDGQNFFQIGNLNGDVFSLVMNGTSILYIGGQFTSSGSTQLNYIGN